ncbi:MAG: DUF4136 domain-containing protein [Spirochaetaceae bacterium]|nr:DUF4136 domain-containing protein [Myxococcales bacterium]MCB9722530.1 DUF4136 domain-containing protein [Spirochaetaceae bacterium]
MRRTWAISGWGWLLCGLLVVAAGCQTFNVRTDWDEETAFGRFQRYAWVEPPEVEGASPFADNDLLRKRLRTTIERVLAERGYRAVTDRAEADFLVTYSVILEERMRVDNVGSTIGTGYYGRPFGWGSVYSTANVRNYQESTLILDLLRPADEALVWRGWGSGIVRTRDRDRGQALLEKGVRAILDEFPPEADGGDSR